MTMRQKFLTLMLACCAAACAVGCSGGGQGSAAKPTFSATPEQRPELTHETIRNAINGTWIEGVPAANGTDKPENWVIERSEPKEINVVEQKMEGDRATVVVDIKTRSHPRARRQMSLEGRLRLTLELRTEFIFREWDVVDAENISFKYTKLDPPPSPSPSPGESPRPGETPNANGGPPPLPPPPPPAN